jgi:hypothetical protein
MGQLIYIYYTDRYKQMDLIINEQNKLSCMVLYNIQISNINFISTLHTQL